MTSIHSAACTVCACILLWSAGCASTPMDRARQTIAYTAQATVLVDAALRARYAAVSAEGDAEHVRRFNRLVESLLLTHAAVMSAERALDDVDAMDEPRIGAILACVTSAVLRLLDALPTVGIELPEVVVMLLTAINGVSSATCDPVDHASTFGVPHIMEVMP